METSTDGEFATEANVNPERLDLSMRLAGIRSAAALAASLGKHEATVRNWTKERAQPHRSTLEELSRLLAVSPAFLTEPAALPALHDANFRSAAKSMRPAHERIGAYAVLFGVLARALVGSRPLPPASNNNPASAAADLRLRHHLSESEPVAGTIQLAWDEGIAVAYAPLDASADSHNIDAFSARVGVTPVIILNPLKGDYFRQRFDVAHEVGHLVMHPSSHARSHSDREREAHEFASRLLFPRTPDNMRLLGRAVSEDSFDSLLALQQQWGISVDALLHVATNYFVGRQRAAAREKARDVRSGSVSRTQTRVPESTDLLPDLVADAVEDSSFSHAVDFIALQSGVPRDYIDAMLARTASSARPWPAEVRTL